MPQIRVQDETYQFLEERRRPGQSFDGVIRERLMAEEPEAAP